MWGKEGGNFIYHWKSYSFHIISQCDMASIDPKQWRKHVNGEREAIAPIAVSMQCIQYPPLVSNTGICDFPCCVRHGFTGWWITFFLSTVILMRHVIT